MSGREFLEWQAYHALWPLGERRADLRAGIIASVIANTQRGKDTPAFHPHDFVPQFDQVLHEDDASADEDADIALTQSIFESLTVQLGGEIKG